MHPELKAATDTPQWFQGLTEWMDEHRPAEGKDIWKTAYRYLLERSAWMGEKEWDEFELRVRDIAKGFYNLAGVTNEGCRLAFEESFSRTREDLNKLEDPYRGLCRRMDTMTCCHIAMGGGEAKTPLPGPVDKLISEIMRAWDEICTEGKPA